MERQGAPITGAPCLLAFSKPLRCWTWWSRWVRGGSVQDAQPPDPSFRIRQTGSRSAEVWEAEEDNARGDDGEEAGEFHPCQIGRAHV